MNYLNNFQNFLTIHRYYANIFQKLTKKEKQKFRAEEIFKWNFAKIAIRKITIAPNYNSELGYRQHF
jgi:glutathione peroxidase-family protein